MIELPEAATLAKQSDEALLGKKIERVIAAFSPHKLTWFHGDPAGYDGLLRGKTIDEAHAYGGQLEIEAGDASLLFSDGVNLRRHAAGEKRPPKHQLLIEFTDETALSASVQMYGGVVCFRQGEYENKYYETAKSKPSPLSEQFDCVYFDAMIASPEMQKLSAKAFLATEQRIPGLGNGVLQDILYNARIHPKRKLATLTDEEKEAMFVSVKSTLREMTEKGGRDTEKDLFGQPGGYQAKLSSKTARRSCPQCGTRIVKEAYMGGSVYYCPGCQKL